MDAFKVLEEKIAVLIERLQSANQACSKLGAENEQLNLKIKALEEALMLDTERLDSLDQEKALTKMVIDDLIKNIDSLVEVDGQ